MNKQGWKVCLQEMKRLLYVAKGNVQIAQDQVDELTFNVSNYEKKIKEL